VGRESLDLGLAGLGTRFSTGRLLGERGGEVFASRLFDETV
jgi:hypothetical protein